MANTVYKTASKLALALMKISEMSDLDSRMKQAVGTMVNIEFR